MARPARLSAWLVLAALPGFSRASSNTTRSSTKSGGGDFDPDKSWWILSTDKNRQAGEMLYLPCGWFHDVTSFGAHCAVNYWFQPPDRRDFRRPYTAAAFWRDEGRRKRRRVA